MLLQHAKVEELAELFREDIRDIVSSELIYLNC